MSARLAPQEFAVVPDMSAQSRALYHYLGNGFIVADCWYRELDAPGEASGVSEFVTQPNTYKAKNLL